jgi:membrane associated rhomboid family serine protease
VSVPPDEAERFELRRPHRPWGAAALLLLLAATVVVGTLQSPASADRWQQLALFGAVTLGILYFVLGLGRRAGPEIIEISPRALRLPFGSASVEVPLDEIEGLALEEGNRPGLFLSTSRFVVFFPRARFASADAAREVHQAIKARIARLPGGVQKVANLDGPRVDALGPAGRPWGSEGLVVLFALVLGLILWKAGLTLERPLDVLRLGVNARVLVSAGEWWRVPGSVLLHVEPVHLLLVAMSLFGLGVAAERLLGTVGFLVVFLGSAAAGALSSAAFPDGAPFTMGASGGVFGLLGSLLYVYWRFRGQIPLRFQIPERTWFGMLGVNFLMPLLVASVDGAMHLGGLLAGVLLTMLLAGDARSAPLGPASKTAHALLGVLVGLYALSVVAVIRTWSEDLRARQLAVVRTLVGLEHADPGFLNTVAWGYGVLPDATSVELSVAEKLAERAVDLYDSPMLRDTWATVAFRRGDVERAISLQLEAITDEAAARKKRPELPTQEGVLVSQLARFLAEARARGGVQVQVDGAPPLRASVSDEGRVSLHSAGPVSRPLTVWVLAREGQDLAGIGRYPVLTSTAPSTIPTRETLAWARTASLSVALVASGTVSERAWPIDAAVLAYPGPIVQH